MIVHLALIFPLSHLLFSEKMNIGMKSREHFFDLALVLFFENADFYTNVNQTKGLLVVFK